MRPEEFIAWVEGFEHSFTGGHPNLEQWQSIKDKMLQVGGRNKPLNEILPKSFPTRFVWDTGRTGDPAPYWQNPVTISGDTNGS